MILTTVRFYSRTKADRIERETGVRITGVEFEHRVGQAPRIIRTIYGRKHN